jgi:hypothetical protein
MRALVCERMRVIACVRVHARMCVRALACVPVHTDTFADRRLGFAHATFTVAISADTGHLTARADRAVSHSRWNTDSTRD